MLTHRDKKMVHILGIAGICLSLTACKPAEIKQYSIEKEKAPIQTLSNTTSTPQADKGFTYTPPTTWQEKQAEGMRKASFTLAKEAEVSVISLPGSAGDLKGNVNRWRRQVGLPPLESEAEIIKDLSTTQIDGVDGFLLDLQAPEGKEDSAMHVAFAKHEGQSWFFKLSGPLEVIKAEIPAFEAFIQSIKFTGDNTQSNSGMSDGPMNGSANNSMNNPMNAQMLGDQPPAPTNISYNTPADWQEQEAGAMRSASFKVEKDNESADISVIALSGDGGGVLSNVNRWRNQAGLGPIKENQLDKMFTVSEVDGHSAYYLSILTDDAESNMLITLIETPESTWFIKMSGTKNLLQAQEKNYLDFVQSIHFESAKESSNG